MPLNSLGIQIERHWREHRPKMVAELEKTNQLEAAIEAAQDLTLDAEAAAVRAGMQPHEARERFREEWAFLPSEEDVPDLPNGHPAQWLGPAWSDTADRIMRQMDENFRKNLSSGIQFPAGASDAKA